jgi:hypothetical protein
MRADINIRLAARVLLVLALMTKNAANCRIFLNQYACRFDQVIKIKVQNSRAVLR